MTNEEVSQPDHDVYEEAPDTKWPTVIGVISLIYAIGGMLCTSLWTASALLTDYFMALGGVEMETPPIIKLTSVALGGMVLICGLIMIVGCAGLLRRRQSGIKWLKVWVVARLLSLVIGFVTTVLTAPAQIQFQQSVIIAQNEMLVEAGRPERPVPSDDEMWQQILLISVAMTATFMVYPVFLGFYLSRRAVKDEQQLWIR